MRLVLFAVFTAALMLMFDLLFNQFGFAHLALGQGVFAACAAAIASYLSRRVVEWKNRSSS
jgi:hypothetical protein